MAKHKTNIFRAVNTT
jgi:hypothetical protein